MAPAALPAISFGAIPRDGGVQFLLFSRHATAVWLLLFDRDACEPTDEIELEPEHHRHGDIWHVFVPGIGPGQRYAYRVDGPDSTEEGHRFDPRRILLDPCAKATTSNRLPEERATPALGGPDLERPRCLVVDDEFDWQEVRPPKIPLADTILYEVHLRGLTRHPSARVSAPGTFLGLIEKIPYFKELGVTALELLPIFEFDHLEHPRQGPDGRRLVNYWGYNPVGFFAPNGRYAKSRDLGAQVVEFKTMVRELHRAGLEVILDVVFNHTAEGNHLGPTIHFKGIDNSIYYFLDADRRFYTDFSGCGNSVNANHPVVREFIVNCLRYWVTQMQVDGFRFDLASVLSRDRGGRLVHNAPLLEAIAEDPVLRDAKIIAEAWDAAGAYQVGSFPGRWAEWNGRYRDEIRSFWRGDPNKTGGFATRFSGSSDLYQTSSRKPFHSINFVTCHDGFTLNDLVSYSHKHNQANGEDGRDGENHNLSSNWGIEGPTNNARIERVRLRTIKNFLATLLLSQGTPMLLGGDELRRTQWGNNNAYCQDNELSWFDWTLLRKHREVYRFCKELIWFRRRHAILRRLDFFHGRPAPGRGVPDVGWFEANGSPKNWHYDDHCLLCYLDGGALAHPTIRTDDDMLLMFNASRRPVTFRLPDVCLHGETWRRFLDTGKPMPFDLFPSEDGPVLPPSHRYRINGHALAVFLRPHRAASV